MLPGYLGQVVDRVALEAGECGHRENAYFLLMSVDDGETVEPVEPDAPLWAVICSSINPAERAELRTIVGSKLVDETEDLHRELAVLLDIWREYRADTARTG